MKKSRTLLILLIFWLFSACEATWTMEINLNDDNSGDYRIAILLDQEAQLYAVETGQTSIGGLNAILNAMEIEALVYFFSISCLIAKINKINEIKISNPCTASSDLN